MSGSYQIVSLANGAKTLFSAGYGEKMHPGLGPMAEAEILCVRQLRIAERMATNEGEFVIWDVGLGAAANATAALRATREIPGRLHLASFDNTAEPLEFALNHLEELRYLSGYEGQMANLLHERRAIFLNGKCSVEWELFLGDFPDWLSRAESPTQDSKLTAVPHAIFYDAFSPAKNPAMWTQQALNSLLQWLNPQRACSLTTYSRSTMLRVTLLLAGFYVGVGHSTGLKEETTVAANHLDLLVEPLNARWLDRVRRSHCAEPLTAPVYRRQPLSPASWEKLRMHRQFCSGLP